MSQMYVVDPAGGRHGGIEAVKYITRQLKILWPLAAILHVPGTGWFWTKCYRIVARNRYRLAGKHTCDGDSCSIHFR